MNIEEAYCCELNTVIDIYQAKEFYFSKPIDSRKRLKFYCPDPVCRASKKPLVVGVNYTQLVEKGNKYRQMHFREDSRHPHSKICTRREKNLLVIDSSQDDEKRNDRVKRPKATDVVDVFRPNNSDRTFVVKSVNSSIDMTKCASRYTEAASGRFNPSLLKDRKRVGITSTSLLERVVNCWSALGNDARRKTEITTAGRSMSYYKAFIPVQYLYPSENGTKITYGGARAQMCANTDPNFAFIDFIDECGRFPEVKNKRSLTIRLPISRIDEYVGGELIRENIRESCKQYHYLKVFAFGTIVPGDGRSGYLLQINSLDNLVLKVQASKHAKT